MMGMNRLSDIPVDKVILVAMGVVMGVVMGIFSYWIVFGDSDWARCERAVPYALVTEARSFDKAIFAVDKAIMCKSVTVGDETETITWLDKKGARLTK